MTIRFLATTESDAVGFPFQAGQEIPVTTLTDRIRRWIRDGLAVIVREEPELAIEAPVERAVSRRSARSSRA